LQLPRSLSELDEIAAVIAANAEPDVIVLAGGRIKHMTTTMNEVLGRHFGQVSATLARQKSRILVASEPRQGEATGYPLRRFDAELGFEVAAHGAAFNGTGLDIGTRVLVDAIPRLRRTRGRAIDLGCGTGIVAVALAREFSGLEVVATDQSQAAVDSARATVAAAGLSDRVQVVRDDALSTQPDASAELILLNPPFHVGATVHTGLAERLFEDAARVLEPGGELWTVWNTHLGYRRALDRIVGPTHEMTRTAKFTLTRSVRR
ncbi:MAG: class I SAM-dependent methyltransferase, partial [Mycetocola sp.]